MAMSFFLFACLVVSELFLNNFVIGISDENENNLNKRSNSTKNETNIVMSRITQPSGPLLLEKPFRLGDPIKNVTNNIKLKEFIPSPPVEEYERNKVRVKPAAPEAKSFKETSETPSNSIPWRKNNWDDRPGVIDWRGGGGGGREGSILNNNVKFPTNSDNLHRFSLDQHNIRDNQNYHVPFADLSYKTTIDSYGSKVPVDAYASKMPLDFSTKTLGDTYGSPERTGIKLPQHKTFPGFNLMEKPTYYEEELYYPSNYGSSYEVSVPHKTQPYEICTEEYGNHHYGAVGVPYHKPPSPWKKIIKFLATILPIGLLISALTPNIISIHNNNTDPG